MSSPLHGAVCSEVVKLLFSLGKMNLSFSSADLPSVPAQGKLASGGCPCSEVLAVGVTTRALPGRGVVAQLPESLFGRVALTSPHRRPPQPRRAEWQEEPEKSHLHLGPAGAGPPPDVRVQGLVAVVGLRSSSPGSAGSQFPRRGSTYWPLRKAPVEGCRQAGHWLLLVAHPPHQLGPALSAGHTTPSPAVHIFLGLMARSKPHWMGREPAAAGLQGQVN